jgi:hypothetical protein
MKPPGLSENLGECVLDQILGLLARGAHRPRGTIEPVDMVPETGRIEKP